MNPYLFDFGTIKIYWYSIFILLAMIIGMLVVMMEAKKHGFRNDFMTNLFFWDIIFGVIGARLYYVIFNFSLYENNLLDIFKIWEGGLAIHGGMIASLIFTLLYCKKYKVNSKLILDIIVVGLIIGQAIGRWGNFFNGEAHGPITTVSELQKLLIPNFIINGMNINGNYYMPTFYFESILCLIGFIVLIIFRKLKYTKVGQVSALYFIWYGVVRFFIEILRTDSLMIGTFKMAQIVSILMILIGIIMFIVSGKGSKFDNIYKDTVIEDINF